MRKALLPPAFGAPIGRYVPGIAAEPEEAVFVFVTGQVAVDEDGAVVGAGSIERQTEQVFRNMLTVLAEAGAGLEALVSVTVYLTDRGDFEGFNAVRNRVFADIVPPASTVVIVAGLVVPEHLVEISGVAMVPGGHAPASEARR